MEFLAFGAPVEQWAERWTPMQEVTNVLISNCVHIVWFVSYLLRLASFG